MEPEGQNSADQQRVEQLPALQNTITVRQAVEINDRIIVKKIVSGDYTEAEKMLLDLEQSVKRSSYESRRIELLHLSTCHYNLACIYQKIWKNHECCNQIERAIENLELQVVQIPLELQKISRRVQLIRCYLQYCAVLSQLGRHDKSLQIAKNIVKNEKQIFSLCLKFCEQKLKKCEIQSEYMGHLMHFDLILIKQAHQKLIYLSQIPDAQQVLQQTRDIYQQISESIYYWKNIPQNNQRLIRKQLKLASDIIPVRNVLGICKKEEWVDSFNIGSVMMMKPRMLEERHRSDLLHIISAKTILQQVFYTSIAYFTIATEIRFKEVESDMKGLKQNQKMMRLSQNDFVKMCKVYHLKAIELAGRFVPTTSQYINHLILSFNKNYKAAMDPIHQQSLLVDSKIEQSNRESMSRKASQPLMESCSKDQRIFQRKNQVYLEDDIKRPPSRKVRSVRSNTRQSGKNKQPTQPNQVNRRSQRFRSLQTYKKRQQIKTFTFKFVKEIKQSNLPKKKQGKKPNQASKKKINKSPSNF